MAIYFKTAKLIRISNLETFASYIRNKDNEHNTNLKELVLELQFCQMEKKLFRNS